MKKFFFIGLLLPLFLIAQEEQDICDKEIEAKCDPNEAVYDCIVVEMGKNKNFFSKECTPNILEKMEAGEFPDPCLQEQQRLCPPGSAPNCVAVNINRISSECQEKITEDGTPKIPNDEEMKKIQEICKGYLMIECGHIEIEMQMALNKEGPFRAKELTDKLQKCIKQAMKNPKDDNCREMIMEYQQTQKRK